MHRRKLLAALPLSALAVTVTAAAAAISPGRSLTYERFDKGKEALHPWVGRNVVVLTRSESLDPNVMQRLLTCLDRGYDFYRGLGAAPETFVEYQGRLVIAQVEKTCGAACGYLGLTGIELSPPVFAETYNKMRDKGAIDQAVMYEFGRNFWLYGDQLGALAPMTTGFACVNRYLAIRYSGFPGTAGDTLGYPDGEDLVLNGLWRSYQADSSLNWRNTLGADRSPPVPPGMPQLSGADWAACVFHRIYMDVGLQGYRKFYAALRQQPKAVTPQAALQNLVQAAGAASMDIAPLMRDPAIRLRS